MEWFKPTEEEFGDPNKYKMLTYICEHLKELDEKPRRKISRYLGQVNKICKTEVAKASPYVYKLIREDFKKGLNRICEKYDVPEGMRTRLHNHTHAKFVNAIADRTPFLIKNTNEVQWKTHEERNHT